MIEKEWELRVERLVADAKRAGDAEALATLEAAKTGDHWSRLVVIGIIVDRQGRSAYAKTDCPECGSPGIVVDPCLPCLDATCRHCGNLYTSEPDDA